MRILIALTVLAGVAGLVCLVVAAQSPAYVDSDGRLVEPFAWMVVGRVLLILFMAGLIIAGALRLLGHLR